MIRFRVIDPITDCWNWTRAKVKNGYAQIESNNKNKYVHRWAYELWIGPIPDGLFVLHHCDNSACFNPDHLFVGTLKQNSEDMVQKGRAANTRGDLNGHHKLSSEQVQIIKNSIEKSVVLAAQFGVHRRTIWIIRANRGWKHIV